MFLFTDRVAPPEKPQAGGMFAPALRQAAEKTGAPFDFLVKTATRESGLKADAKAKTSSATGLFQFVEQTWLSLVRSDGAGQGLGREAALIEPDGRGRMRIADPGERNRILALRTDPDVASRMAGVLANKNRDSMARALGREPTQGELYIGHFLGAAGGSLLVRMKERAPGLPASAQLPAAAAANRAIFYDRRGAARSAGDVYDRLVAGFSPEPARAVAVVTPEPRSGNRFHGLFASSGMSPPSAAVARALFSGPAGGPPNATGTTPAGAPLDLKSFSRVRSRAS